MQTFALTIVSKGVLEIREQINPEAGAGEVLVRVRAAGVNNADLGQRMGLYPAPADSPQDVAGLEFAGEVVATGILANRFSIGDRVMGVVGGGAQAELLSVHERLLMPVPPSLAWEQAGGFPEAFVTAHDALFTQGNFVGDRVKATIEGLGVQEFSIAAEA
jgi:NADPH2:quinone reductase